MIAGRLPLPLDAAIRLRSEQVCRAPKLPEAPIVLVSRGKADACAESLGTFDGLTFCLTHRKLTQMRSRTKRMTPVSITVFPR